MEFDDKTQAELGNYVYILVDPRTNRPFYVGRGVGNRVFQHENAVESNDAASTEKEAKIREIISSGSKVNHVIVRHGLSDREAAIVEASLIDFAALAKVNLTNIARGFHSDVYGAMSVVEVARRYSSEKLSELENHCAIININRSYSRSSSPTRIYDAVKEAWPIAASKVKEIRFVLAEYKGCIVDVFEVEEWYELPTTQGRSRWGFHGKQAEQSIREKYLYKSIAKRRGAAFPVTYILPH